MDQPDIAIVARIPTDKEHTREEVPPWSDLVLEFTFMPWKSNAWTTGGSNPHATLHLTRAAGESIIDALHNALHPHAGRSILAVLWEDLDRLTSELMVGEEDTDKRGIARGLAWAIAVMQNPANPNIDAVRDEAVERYSA
jgi:hypothetical protein